MTATLELVKRCSGCKTELPIEDFSRNKRTKDGRSCYCKPCVKHKNRAQYENNRESRIQDARTYRVENREKVIAAERKRYEARKPWRKGYSEHNRERIREQSRAFRAANPGYHGLWRQKNHATRLAFERQHRAANRDLYRRWEAARRAADPEPFRMAKHRYRAAVRANGRISFTIDQWEQKLAFWGHRCWICRSDLFGRDYQIDHVKPISKGGMHCLSNLRPACESCNKSKSGRWPFALKKEEPHA